MDMKEFFDKLKECVIDGEEDDAVELTREAIESGIAPIDVVQKGLVPILDEMGEQFARLEIFLPDLVISADVAKVVKDEVREHILNSAEESDNKGTVVIGTVKGDVHDIGKNIVSTLLEVSGYKVVDLGNDVDPYNFVETARKEKADIIALSSLLTTSMPFMIDVLKLLDGLNIRKDFKVIVGGGPVSQAWADEIGADGYSNDANDAVALCNRIMAGE